MGNREIRFRAWDLFNERMVEDPYRFVKWYESYSFAELSPSYVFYESWQDDDDGILRPCHIMQYVGLKDKHGKEIYEGDIFRVEEDSEDLIYYLVIVWVKEWCMFATLRVEDEYKAYLSNGISALDEPMFWTYTLEDTNDRRFFLCGNIYENPELCQ